MSKESESELGVFLQRGGAWEGFVFVLVFVMIIITTDVGRWFAASGSSSFFCFIYVSSVPLDPTWNAGDA